MPKHPLSSRPVRKPGFVSNDDLSDSLRRRRAKRHLRERAGQTHVFSYGCCFR